MDNLYWIKQEKKLNKRKKSVATHIAIGFSPAEAIEWERLTEEKKYLRKRNETLAEEKLARYNQLREKLRQCKDMQKAG